MCNDEEEVSRKFRQPNKIWRNSDIKGSEMAMSESLTYPDCENELICFRSVLSRETMTETGKRRKSEYFIHLRFAPHALMQLILNLSQRGCAAEHNHLS